MDYQYYLDILKKRKWAIFLTILLAALAGFFIAKSLPPSYRTGTIIATGALNYEGGDDPGAAFIQQYQIDARFNNLIEQIKSRKMSRLIGYRLLIHDLDPANIPFREPEEFPDDITEQDISELVAALKDRINVLNPLLPNQKMDYNYKELAKAYEYDFESFEKFLEVGRVKKTDYLQVASVAENAGMVSFIANNISKDYIQLATENKFEEHDQLVGNFGKLAKDKRRELDSLSLAIRTYRQNQLVTNTSEQSKALVNKLTDFEEKKDEAAKEIIALTANIKHVESELKKLTDVSSSSSSQASTSSKAIAALKKEINALQDQYISDGSNSKKLQVEITKKKNQLNRLVLANSGSLVAPSDQDNNREEELYSRKIELEIQLENAQRTKTALEGSILTLKNKIPSLALHDTELAAMESEKERLEDEYTAMANRFSSEKAKASNQTIPLEIIEFAQIPEESESSKALYISGFSGLGAGALASMAVFLLAFFDNKLSNPHQFKQLTKLPLLGTIPVVKGDIESINLFKTNQKDLVPFKENLRSIRYAMEGTSEDVFLITGMKEGDGKSFVLKNLAKALAANGKKVLIIDTNFRNNSLSDTPPTTFQFGVILEKTILEFGLEDVFKINQNTGDTDAFGEFDLISNTGLGGTPSEVFAGKDFGGFLEEMIEVYDVILMEGPAIGQYADAKELIDFSDKVISVFGANASLDSQERTAVQYLKSLNSKYLGSILNGLDSKNLN